MFRREDIKVKGHIGSWYVVDELVKFGQTYYLLEHQTHGEDAPWIAIDEEGELVMEDITGGAEELSEFLEEEFVPHFDEDREVNRRIEAGQVNPYPSEDYDDDVYIDYDEDEDEDEDEEEDENDDN